MSAASSNKILIIEDEQDVLDMLTSTLRKTDGFTVITASDGATGLRMAREERPALVVLDLMLPKMPGLEVCKALKNDSATKQIPIIMLTAKSLSADRVVGLTAGADDYIIKPFDPVELVARVKSALRRVREMRSVNPLTQLPGNVQVQEEVAKHVATGVTFALMYIDLDNFKAFNDHYGFLRGDEAIKMLAASVEEAVHQEGGGGFVGHVGGDDFVALVKPEVSEQIANGIIQRWDQRAATLYDAEDLARGYIEIADRRNQVHHFPITTVSIGIASNAQKPIGSHWQASEIATEMKQFAKRDLSSSYAMDRRSQASTRPAPPAPVPR